MWICTCTGQYRNLVNFRATNFSILIVCCGYFSLSSFTHEILSPCKKRQTIITYLPGHVYAYLVEDVREHEAASGNRRYHIYHDIWTAAIGEELDCVTESGNMRDRYAVAVKRAGVTVGHTPKNHVCSEEGTLCAL